MRAIKNAKIILENEIVSDKVLIFDDKIRGLADMCDISGDVETIDAEGGYVSPGFIDLHIHGYLGHDVCDGDADGIRAIARGLAENGVVGFLPTTMTVDIPTLRRALQACREVAHGNEYYGAEVLGVHMEGPFISAAKRGAQDGKFILKPDADLIIANSDIIKIITLAPEEDEGFEIIKKIANETNIVISMGHTAADYKTALESTENGVSHATHLFNAMTPMTHRAPGVVGAVFNSDVSCELIVDDHHVDPALYDIVYRLKGDRLCFITDCLSAGGLGEGEYTLGGSKIICSDELCRLEYGTIAGSVLRLNRGIWNVYRNSSVSLCECVRCASLNPATVLGLADRKGSISIGKDADLVVLDDEFNVKKTIIGGIVKYDSRDHEGEDL